MKFWNPKFWNCFNRLIHNVPNGQTYLKILAAFAALVCLTILGHYALKG